MSSGAVTRATESIRSSLRLIILGGSLAMVFMVTVTCPAYVEFLREIGASEFHFGLLSGIPLIFLILQFFGAVIANRVHRRKPLFMFGLIAGRVVLVAMVLLPLVFPLMASKTMIMWMIVITALNSILMHSASPSWFSWMADLVPRRILNRYWGVRHRWMQIVWVGTMLAVAGFLYLMKGSSALLTYPILVIIGVTAGVLDILLFVRVKEPENHTLPDVRMVDMLLGPFRDHQFRSFIVYSCVWPFCVMFAAVFMQLYVLKMLGLPQWQVTLIWCLSGVGNAMAAGLWGVLADRHGHRPILAICFLFKPLVLVVFLLVTSDTALWLLSVVFVVDGAWNAGIFVGNNGYMMKMAPRKNRSMFMAVVTGLGGIFGGVGAMVGGGFLRAFEDVSLHLLGRDWNHYHLLFAVGFLLRVGCLLLVLRIREAKSSRPTHVVNDILGASPLRFFRVPVGLDQGDSD